MSWRKDQICNFLYLESKFVYGVKKADELGLSLSYKRKLRQKIHLQMIIEIIISETEIQSSLSSGD
jgi:hypothetical protein